MPSPDIEITTSDLQRQIIAIGARMDHGFDELKDLFQKSDERMRALENREAACQPIVTAKIDAAWREIDDHKTQIKGLKEDGDRIEKAIVRLEQQNKLLLWIAGIEGAGLLGWVVSQLLNLIGK